MPVGPNGICTARSGENAWHYSGNLVLWGSLYGISVVTQPGYLPLKRRILAKIDNALRKLAMVTITQDDHQPD